MDYIYGTARRGGVTAENLKTVGEQHTDLTGFVSTRREFGDGTAIEDRCRVLQKYKSAEAGSLCYDWYFIDSHIRYMDTTRATQGLAELQETGASEARLTSQMQAAVKLYVQKAADIPDALALEMPDLFRTWDEVLAAGEQLEADTVLNLDGQLYRVVQPVTPQEHQRPDGEGMLAIYRPIDQTHEGTKEDPVPFVYGMDVQQGTYYSSGGKTYLCNLTMTPCVWAPGTPGLWQWTEVTE